MIRDRPPTETYQFIEPGLYNIKQLTNIIALNNTSWLEMNINEKSGEFTLVLKKERNKIKFSSDLVDLLGLPKDLLTLGTCTYHGNFDLHSFNPFASEAVYTRNFFSDRMSDSV